MILMLIIMILAAALNNLHIVMHVLTKEQNFGDGCSSPSFVVLKVSKDNDENVSVISNYFGQGSLKKNGSCAINYVVKWHRLEK